VMKELNWEKYIKWVWPILKKENTERCIKIKDWTNETTIVTAMDAITLLNYKPLFNIWITPKCTYRWERKKLETTIYGTKQMLERVHKLRLSLNGNLHREEAKKQLKYLQFPRNKTKWLQK
jgi:excinuclease UvrABC helicase subunit UvrB